MTTAVRYELWEDEHGLSFFPEGSESFLRLLSPSAKLVWSCVADTWLEAQAKKHDHLGWAPYEPI